MIGASKILTVSYGTFSCTLEGFEEPFSTMKAIAEYFRDLAADDRYFGAEPPTPDAEMLHRIAEREIQRRVEAKINDNGVVLRAELGPVSAEVVPAQGMAPAAAPEMTRPAERLAPAMAVAPRAAATDSLSAEGSAAARLSRLRAAVEQARSAGQNTARAAAPIYGEDIYTEDLLAEDNALAATEPAPVMVADVAQESVMQAVAAAEPMAEPAPEVGDDATVEMQAAVEAVAEAPIAAALEPQWQAEAGADAAFEPEADDLILPMTDDAEDLAWIAGTTGAVAEPELTAREMLATASAMTTEPEAESAVQPFASAEAEEAFDDEDDATIAAVSSLFVEPAAEQDAEPDMAAHALDPSAAADAAQQVLQGMAAANQDDDETLAMLSRLTEDAFAPEPDMPAEAELLADLPGEMPQAPEADAEPPALADGSRRPRARVIKVRRADWSGAEPAADMETRDVAEDPVLLGIKASLDQTGLSSQDQDELMSELAEVAREMDQPEAAPEVAFEGAEEAADEMAELPHRSSDGRTILETASESQEDAISRLFDQTNNELEGTENRRRLSAIAHLKAAVAANEAEKEVNPEGLGAKDTSELDRYREDLAQVVRPRRPEIGTSQIRRPAPLKDRPAPLVLVSEQRIDRPSQPREQAMIRPRRVMTSALVADDDMLDDEDEDMALTAEEQGSILADSKSFAEFAERIGASDLVDLLEAAAAYAATVEGRPSFSRPQIMKRVQTMSAEDQFSREDGLRSFGMLLRQGKIQKVRRGQFAIAKSSRYIDEARRIGE